MSLILDYFKHFITNLELFIYLYFRHFLRNVSVCSYEKHPERYLKYAQFAFLILHFLELLTIL